jgi:crotonobetainyl-CoA:carnitine CoA-transferase CaiB-like acyl-CoA transferase
MLTGGIPCYRCYATADGRHLAVAALEPHFWARFCALIGRDDLVSCGHSHGEEGERTVAAIALAIAAHDFSHWRSVLADVDVCVEPVLTLEEAVADAQHRARAVFGPDGLPLPPTSPRTAAVRAVPRLGADTERIARSLGYSDDEISALAARGVVRLAQSPA